jgi:hypothetical protein
VVGLSAAYAELFRKLVYEDTEFLDRMFPGLPQKDEEDEEEEVLLPKFKEICSGQSEAE